MGLLKQTISYGNDWRYKVTAHSPDIKNKFDVTFINRKTGERLSGGVFLGKSEADRLLKKFRIGIKI